MNFLLQVGHFLAGFPHFIKKGHFPQFYDLGAGQRYLVCCANGGGGGRELPFVHVHARMPAGM